MCENDIYNEKSKKVEDICRFQCLLNVNAANSKPLMHYSGDEFGVCLPDVTLQKAEHVWQRIIERIKKINAESHKKFIISLSHGIGTLSNTKSVRLDEVIKHADIKSIVKNSF